MKHIDICKKCDKLYDFHELGNPIILCGTINNSLKKSVHICQYAAYNTEEVADKDELPCPITKRKMSDIRKEMKKLSDANREDFLYFNERGCPWFVEHYFVELKKRK